MTTPSTTLSTTLNTTPLDSQPSHCADTDKASTCPRCGARFTCGNVAGAATCWCTSLPVLASADKAATACYCPTCLRELLAAEAAGAAKAGEASVAAVSPARPEGSTLGVPTFGTTGAPDSTRD